MKNFILGIIVSIGLLISIKAFAVSTNIAWYTTSELRISSLRNIYKTYDEDTNIVCYVYDGDSSGGISCLKNK